MGVGDGELRQPVAVRGVFVQPQAEGVFGHAADEGAGLPGGEALLGLAAELRLGQLGGKHVGALLPDVLAGDLDAPGQEVPKLAELPQRLHQAAAQARHMGAAGGRGNEIHIALRHRHLARHAPLQRPLHGFFAGFRAVLEGGCWQALFVAEGGAEIAAEARFVAPALRFRFVLRLLGLNGERDGEPRAKHRFRPQQVAQAGQRDAGGVEVGGIRQEAQPGAGVALADFAHHFQRRRRGAGLEALLMHRAVLLHFHHQPFGERVHYGNAHPMQAAGEAVAVVVELAAGVQLGEDQLDAGELVVRVHVHGHAAAIVDHFDCAVAAQRYVDVAAMAVQRFVHAVVHHLLNKVVGRARVRVHARPPAHRVETGEHLDGFGGIGLAHGAAPWLQARLGGCSMVRA